MADEKIVIKIDVDARTTAIEKTTQAVKRLRREAGKFSSGKNDPEAYFRKIEDRLGKTTNQMRRHFDFFDRGIKASGMVLKKFVTTALKGVILEMGLMGAAMLGIHALFVSGRFLAKAYAGAMQIIAGGTAAAAVAIATAAAAIREQQAAMYAYRGKGAAEFGSGLNQAQVAMRALQMDANLAGLGVANLNKAYAAMSKTMTTPQINASTAMFKSLMDFGAAGQDPGAAAEKVGAMIAALSDSKKSLGDVQAAAKELGPEMEKALKDANVKSKDQLKKLIMSGELAKLGGVAGQFDAVNQTLIGQIKTFFALVKGQFADFGGQFLEPAKIAMQRIFRIISRDIRRMMGAVSGFGTGAFMDGLVTAVDKTSTWMVNLVEKWLPRADGFFSRIGDWWEGFKHGWNRMVESMRPFIEGARVLESAFSPIWEAIKGGAKNFTQFNELLQENRAEVLEFGTRVGEIITSISNFSMKLKAAFFDVLPIINDVLSGVKQIFDILAGGMTKLSGSGMFGSLLPIMGMFLMGRQMSQTKGGFMPKNLGSMNVNAQVVNVGGPGIGGPVQSGFSSGANRPTMITDANRNRLTQQQLSQMNISNVTPISAQNYGPGGATASRSWWSRMNDRAVGPLSKEYDPSKMGRFAKLRQSMRYGRSESVAGAKIFGNEKLGIKGINNSMGARLGVGMGMGMLSQYAPEEMRGALALGGTVGMFNPMAGLAVGLGGAALKSNNAFTGALAGAGGGAAMGMMVAGPAGAAVGAALGTMTGIIAGSANRLKKQAAESRGVIKGAFDGLIAAVQSVAFTQISQNRATLEAGGSLAGKPAALGQGSSIIKKRFAGVQGDISKVIAMGDTDKTNWSGNIAGGAALGGTLGGLTGAGIFSVPLAIGGALVGATVGTLVSVSDWALGQLVGDGKKAKAQTKLLEEIYANQAQLGLEISKEQYELMKKDKEAAIKELGKQFETTIAVNEKMDSIYNGRLSFLSEMSGKSAAEIEVLAQQLGVNLYDATKKTIDVAKELGFALTRSSAEIQAAMRSALLSPTSMFDTEIKAIKAAETLDMKARTLRDQFVGGGLSQDAKLQYAQELSADMLAYYKGDAVKALFEMQKAVGIGGSQYTAGGALAGMEGELAPLFDRLFGAQKSGMISEAGVELQGILGKSGLTAKSTDIQAMFQNLDPAKQQQLLSIINSGSFAEVAGRMGGTVKYLESMGLDPAKLTEMPKALDEMATDMGAVAENMGIAVTDFKAAVDKLVTQTNEIFNPTGKAPAWWNTKPTWWDGGDTSSPRGSSFGDTTTSRLSQTMARHAALNGQLTGTRTVTSSYRNFGLGSPSSDHVMGRAYDLVGQNLGSYAKLVHANGGFAEFHGRNASRHLHVVPGPGPFGDTSVPSMSRAPQVVSNGQGSSVTNNITVNGAPGQSPEAIAIAVMQKIDERNRNREQRR